VTGNAKCLNQPTALNPSADSSAKTLLAEETNNNNVVNVILINLEQVYNISSRRLKTTLPAAVVRND
jgi:hypothetical protein